MFVCNCWYYFMVQFFSNNYTTLYFIKYWLFIVNSWLSYIAHKLLIFLSYDFVLVNFLLLFCRIYNFILIQMRLFLPHNLFNIYILNTFFMVALWIHCFKITSVTAGVGEFSIKESVFAHVWTHKCRNHTLFRCCLLFYVCFHIIFDFYFTNAFILTLSRVICSRLQDV